MAEYNNIQGRADLTSIQLPDQIFRDVIQTPPEQSIMLSNARRVAMSSKKTKQPVLNSLPSAYWVNDDTGLKQTTKVDWKEVYMTAEELAVIVPVPDALIDDANIPLYDEVAPLLVEAIGKKVDEACLFGVDKPSSWPADLVSGATTAEQKVERSESDLGIDVADLGALMAKKGTPLGAFVAEPGLQWELRKLRDANNAPIYTPIAGTPNSGLYGFPLNECMNGVWDSTKAILLAVNWNRVVIGIRQDITMDVFREGVITDDTGKVILNLMQQDTTALRVVFRVGYAVNEPLTRVSGEKSYPAGVIVPKV